KSSKIAFDCERVRVFFYFSKLNREVEVDEIIGLGKDTKMITKPPICEGITDMG
ncbi:16792_t:CDS:2, partial [Funneliformis geosporum]